MSNFPQELCKMCGKCCKSITTNHTYEELKDMTRKGSESARVFIEIFKPYASIEEARKVIPEQIDQVLKELEQNEGFDINKVTFYYCPHLSPDNKCGIYECRPECCRRAPNSAWACMPPGCGFEGWQFEEREKIKHQIRKLKEYLIAAEAVNADNAEELKNLIAQKIKPLEKYGAMYW